MEQHSRQKDQIFKSLEVRKNLVLGSRNWKETSDVETKGGRKGREQYEMRRRP